MIGNNDLRKTCINLSVKYTHLLMQNLIIEHDIYYNIKSYHISMAQILV